MISSTAALLLWCKKLSERARHKHAIWQRRRRVQMRTVVPSEVAAIIMVTGAGAGAGARTLTAATTRVGACVMSAIVVVIFIVVVVVVPISVAATVEAKAIVLVVGPQISAWIAGPVVAIVVIAALHELPISQCCSSACTAWVP